MGEHYIHKFYVDPNTQAVTQYRLASDIQVESTQPNVHYLKNKNLVVWNRSYWGNYYIPKRDIYAVSFSVSAKFPSTIESTGNVVYQLSTQAGNNTTLYYHNNDWEGSKYLIYRHMDGGSASTLVYQRLDLESGEDVALTPTGQTNGGFVRGGFLYVYQTESGGRRSISRYDLSIPYDAIHPTSPTRICYLDDGWGAAADVAVNSDGTYVLGLEQWRHDGQDERWLVQCRIADGERKLVMNSVGAEDAGIEHFQFSPTDPLRYTYINQNHAPPDNRGIARLGIGIVNGSNTRLTSNFYLDSFVYWHPFYGADGALWSDAGSSTQTSNLYFRRFSFDCVPFGSVCSVTDNQITLDKWQKHYSMGPDGNWFVGDGQASDPDKGERYIHKLFVDPAPPHDVKQIRLADGVGTAVCNGDSGASAHYVANSSKTLNQVVWTSCIYLGGTAAQQKENVFAVDFMAR
jgi:hypothetical protein